MLKLLDLKPEAFGLDISDLCLRIAKLQKKRDGFVLSSYNKTPIPAGIIKDGEIKKEKELVEIIKKAVSSVKLNKLNSKYVIVSLPEEKAFLQVIQMPRLSPEDLRSAVIYEAENYIPLGIEEVYMDSQLVQPVRDHLDHQDVLIAALPRKTVDPYVNVLKSAGLKPLALEIESLAIARSLIENELSNNPTLIIDLGASRTSFIVFSGYALRFTSSIPVSSEELTMAISRTLQVDSEKAEKLKMNYGLETKATREGGQVFDALIPPLTDLIEQIKKCLVYYQTHSSHEHLLSHHQNVEKIMLCGGGANLKGLPDFLARQLSFPVVLGNPWVNISSNDKALSPEKSLGCATVLGLALRGIKT